MSTRIDPPPARSRLDEALGDLANVLWRQRRLLELLQYKLEVQQLLLAAGRAKWVSTAAREVEHVLEAIRRCELERAVQVEIVIKQLGGNVEASLRALIDAVPSPWNVILREHQTAFLEMTSEIDTLTKHNRELLNRGYQATREFMTALAGEEVAGYSASGTTQRLSAPTHTMDWTA